MSMDDEELIVGGGDDLDYDEYDLDEEQEKALLEEAVSALTRSFFNMAFNVGEEHASEAWLNIFQGKITSVILNLH